MNTNSCTAIEGLASAANGLANPEAPLSKQLATRLPNEMAKNLELQVLPGQISIHLGAERYLVNSRLPDFAGAFLNGRARPKRRIDFTQHCLSALLKYKALPHQLRASSDQNALQPAAK